MRENNMKSKHTHRHPEPNWQGKGAGKACEKSQAKPTCVSSPAPVKPFAGKVFYLDLPSNRKAEKLEGDIKDLGGTVEKFFSKEIRYLVSNKREARYVHCLRKDPPVPSPGSGPSSPQPAPQQQQPAAWGQHEEQVSGPNGFCEFTFFIPSRGKSLVERVVKEQERVKMNKILSNALEWGVKIVYIDAIVAYIQKKQKNCSRQCPATTAAKTSVKAGSAAKQGFQKCKAGRISKPFVKVEDSSRHYRPISLTMPNMPVFNLKTLPPCSPFFVHDKVNPGIKQPGHRGVKASASEERANVRKKNRDKKRGGYCECCLIKYENVSMHLKSERHKDFSKSDEYLVVDQLVSTLHFNFLHIKSQVKRLKCSVSSVLFVPEPCGKTALRHETDLDPTEIIKGEQHQTADGHMGSYSGHTLKISSVTDSAPLNHIEGERRNNHSNSDRSKRKSLARKRPCRQNSLTSRTQKAEQTLNDQQNMETAPSGGEFLRSRETQDNKEHQTISPRMNSSPSHLHDVNTHQLEESDEKQDSSVCEAAQEGNVLPDQKTGNNLSEREGVSLPSASLAPVIQRRVRVYKRKRRKMSTHDESAKPSDIPNKSLLRLFQSSDDMEVEFLGFED
ncbi:protein DBF4 homolog A [Notothenia coriiceps]|uniref:Protein DBF4 homolog A n=1 Tax=Notothenia coriiceps TaxID=8208 RepID=A0A6I9PB08_9TELE|nr:PREDICTED: protein DBF4 homolog A [Notothenia coriiceps]